MINISKNNEDFELKHYLKIIDVYMNEEINEEKKDLWKNQNIIELMSLLEHAENRLLVKNALILLITLFEDIPPDMFNNRGIDTKQLSKKQIKQVILNLKKEIDK